MLKFNGKKTLTVIVSVFVLSAASDIFDEIGRAGANMGRAVVNEKEMKPSITDVDQISRNIGQISNTILNELIARPVSDHWMQQWVKGSDYGHIRICPTCHHFGAILFEKTTLSTLLPRLETPRRFVIDGKSFLLGDKFMIYRKESSDIQSSPYGFLWYDGRNYVGINNVGEYFFAKPLM